MDSLQIHYCHGQMTGPKELLSCANFNGSCSTGLHRVRRGGGCAAGMYHQVATNKVSHEKNLVTFFIIIFLILIIFITNNFKSLFSTICSYQSHLQSKYYCSNNAIGLNVMAAALHYVQSLPRLSYWD
jgi:hypothetical protein